MLIFNREGILESTASNNQVAVAVEQHATNTSSVLIVKLVMKIILHLLVAEVQSADQTVELSEEAVEVFARPH